MAGKLSQHMAVSCILFKNEGDLKLKLAKNHTLFFLLLVFINGK